jgi:glycosyltransferase involved in cell wall biosynthesis
MNKKRVLFIISNLTGGGAEHVARKNIECLVNRDDYILAVITSDRRQVFNNRNVLEYTLADFRKSSSYRKMIKMINIRSNYYNAIKIFREFKPNIIHLHEFIPFSPSLLKAILYYKKESNCIVIMTHHTYSYICTNDSLYNYNSNCLCEECAGTYNLSIIKNKCTGNQFTSIAKYIQKRLFKKYLFSLMDLHISPSTFMKEKYLEYLPNLNIKVVYNPCIDRIKNNFEIKKDINKNCIVYFGRVNKEKNIDFFVETFCESNYNLKLLIIGTGNSQEKISQLIKDNPHADIEFINKFIPTDQLEIELEKGNYFVLPSVWYENSPVSIIEGINNGLIPVLSNLGGMKELGQLFDFGYMIDANNKKSIKEILMHLSNANSASMNFKSSRLILKKFTLEQYQKEINDLYTSLLYKEGKNG